MPHSAFVVTSLNDIFSHPLTVEQRSFVLNGATLRDTLLSIGAVGDATSDDLDIIAASLGESVQAAILAVLRSAAARNLPVVFQWKPSHYGSASLFEAVDEDGVGVIGCTVEVPWLRDAGASKPE